MSTPVTVTSDALTMKRLGYIRLLYQDAVAKSHEPTPLNFSAALSFHDVCEYYFLVAADLHRMIATNPGLDLVRDTFSTNISKLRLPDGKLLSSRDAVKRIAVVRDAFKHNGLPPSQDQIEQSRRDSLLFLESNCQRAFGCDFGDISMLHIVPQDAVRDHLKAARVAADASDLKTAMGELAVAFNQLLFDWGAGKHLPGSAFFTSHFNMRQRWGGRDRRVEIGYGGSEDMRRVASGLAASVKAALAEVDKELETIRAVVRIQIAGVDMAGYLRFAMIAPEADLNHDGTWTPMHKIGQLHYTAENYERCETFVVQAALKIGHTDFSLWMPMTHGDVTDAFAALNANGGRLPDGYKGASR